MLKLLFNSVIRKDLKNSELNTNQMINKSNNFDQPTTSAANANNQNDNVYLINQLESKIELLTQKSINYENEKEHLLKKNTELSLERDNLIINVNSLNQTINEIKLKLTNLEMLLNEKETQIKEFEEMKTNYIKILNEKEVEIKKLTTALVKANEAHIPVSLEYKWKEIDNLLDKKDLEFKNLEQCLNETEVERDRLVRENERLIKEVDDHVRLNEINSDLIKISKQETDLNRSIKIELEKTKIALEEENLSLKSELEKLRPDYELEYLKRLNLYI